MRTIKNPQDGIRVQIVLKLTNKLKMVEIEADSGRIDYMSSRSEMNSLNYDTRICL